MSKKLSILLMIFGLAVCCLWFLFTQDWRGNDNLKYINTKYSYGL